MNESTERKRRHSGQPLTISERNEAEGLVNVANCRNVDVGNTVSHKVGHLGDVSRAAVSQ